MIIPSDKKAVVLGNVMAEDVGTFQIKTSAKAFDILSSGLYSDKIRAVIRELLSNAVDSHIQAGKADVAVDMHLPNSLEPYFSVKDYGVGLSDEQIQGELVPYLDADGNQVLSQPVLDEISGEVLDPGGHPVFRREGGLYTTYFDSSKADSNAYIGALGLGSKSPFCYVPSFSVISVFEGVQRVYSCFVSESGLPSITMMDESPTEPDVCNGVEVQFPVKSSDFWTFREKAAIVLEFFPNVKTNISITPRAITYTLNGDRWKMRSNSHKSIDGHTGMRAIQGPVAYPVILDQNILTPEQQQILTLPLDLFFEIGEVEVAASREALQYRRATIEALKTRLDLVLESFVTSVKDRIELCKNPWEARQIYFETTATEVGRVAKGKIADIMGSYKNFKFEEHLQLDLNAYPFLHFSGRDHSNYNRKMSKLKGLLSESWSGKYNLDRFLEEKDRLSYMFIFDDIGRHVDALTKHIIQNDMSGSYRKIIVVSPAFPATDPVTGANVTPFDPTWKRVPSDIALKEWTDAATALGIPEFKLLSDWKHLIPETLAGSTLTKSKRDRTGVYSWGGAEGNSFGQSWEHCSKEDIENEEDIKYYMVLDKYKPTEMGELAGSPRQLDNTLNMLKRLKVIPEEAAIYGITRISKKIEKDASWVNFLDLITKETPKLFTPAVMDNLKFLKAVEVSSGTFLRKYDFLRNCVEAVRNNHRSSQHFIFSKELESHELREVSNFYANAQIRLESENSRDLEELAHWLYTVDKDLHKGLVEIKPATGLYDKAEALYKKYPMLVFISNSYIYKTGLPKYNYSSGDESQSKTLITYLKTESVSTDIVSVPTEVALFPETEEAVNA